MDRPRILPFVLIAGVVAVSTAAILIKLCDDAPAPVIAAARLGIATLILLPGTAVFRGWKSLRIPSRYIGHMVLAGLFLAGHFFFWITSLKHTSVLSSVVIVTTNPIFVGLASYALFKERLHKALLAAIALAGAGGAIIAVSDAGGQSGSLYGDFMSLCGAVMGSCYFLVGRKVRKDVDILSYILPVYAVAALALVAVAWGTGHSFAGYKNSTYLYFTLLAVVPQLIGHSSLNWSLRYMTATMLTVFVLGEPIGATIIAYFVLGETVTALQLLGGGLILIGIWMASRRRSE